MTAVKPVRPPALTPAALQQSRNCRSTEQCTSTNTDSIDGQGFTKTWNLPDLGSAIFASVASTNQSTHGVEQFYEGEGEDNRN